VTVVEASGATAELGPYRHFMQKEIFEQPRAVADTLEAVGAIDPTLFGAAAPQVLTGIDSVLVLACGIQLLRRVGGQVLDREPRAHPVPGRDRERVPLSRQRAQSERAGWSSSRSRARPPIPSRR